MKPIVAIIGVGLIGGSLGQALRRTGRYRILGIARRGDTLRAARRCGAIDEGSMDLQEVRRATIIVLATPVAQVLSTLRRILPNVQKDAWVTDVSSVKGAIEKGVAPLLRRRPDIHFVGAHPLAGSHKTGVLAARPDLFKGATCVLVAKKGQPIGVVDALWRAAGARTLRLSAQQHDGAVALTSHLPHLVAHALVLALKNRRDRTLLKALLGGSFRDVTRVAAADPAQWTQIFQANQPALSTAVKEFLRALNDLRQQLPRKSLAAALGRSQRFRLPLFDGSPTTGSQAFFSRPPSPKLRRTSPEAYKA